jgi:hypothetical protein
MSVVPIEHAAFHIADVIETEASEDGSGGGAADADATDGDDVTMFVLIELGSALRKFAQ